MTIEIITKHYDRYVLNKESMTWYAWLRVNTTPPSSEKFEGVIGTWPVAEDCGVETLSTPGIESYIKSWREIPDEQSDVFAMPVLPSTSVPSEHESQAAEKLPEVGASPVSMPSPSPVPDSGTDWIK